MPSVRFNTFFSGWAKVTRGKKSQSHGPTATTRSAILHSLISCHCVLLPLDMALSKSEYVFNIESSSGAVCTIWTHLHQWLSLIIRACLPSFTPWPMIMPMERSSGGKLNQSSRSYACRPRALTIRTLQLLLEFLSSSVHSETKKVTDTLGCSLFFTSPHLLLYPLIGREKTFAG